MKDLVYTNSSVLIETILLRIAVDLDSSIHKYYSKQITFI